MATVRTHKNKVKSYVTLLLLICTFSDVICEKLSVHPDLLSQKGSGNHEKLVFRVNVVDDTLQFKDPLKRTIATRIRRSLRSASTKRFKSK